MSKFQFANPFQHFNPSLKGLVVVYKKKNTPCFSTSNLFGRLTNLTKKPLFTMSILSIWKVIQILLRKPSIIAKGGLAPKIEQITTFPVGNFSLDILHNNFSAFFPTNR